MISKFTNDDTKIYLLTLLLYLITILNFRNPIIFTNFSITFIIYILSLLNFIFFLFITIKKSKISMHISGVLVLLSTLLLSVISSFDFSVSFFKYIIFFIYIAMLSMLYNYICFSDKMFGFLILKSFRNINRVVIIISIPIYILGLGYTRNATGFSGALSHPQAFGVFLVLALLLEIILKYISKEKYSLYFIAMLILILSFSYFSESRLSFFSIIFLFVVSLLCKKKNHEKLIIIISFIGLLFVFSNSISDVFSNVLSKQGRSNDTGVEALYDSRGKLVISSLDNFYENPILGIGFQVSNGKHGSYPMTVKYNSLGVPIEANIEKGVFWSALLEETGVLGAFGFVLTFLFFLYKTDRVIIVILLSTIFMIGCGESFYFSIGGLGSFFWLLIFVISACVRLK